MTTIPRIKIHQAYSRYHSSLESLDKEYSGTAMSLSDYRYDQQAVERQLESDLKELGSLPLAKIRSAYNTWFSATKEARQTYTRTGQAVEDYNRALKRADNALNTALEGVERNG